ncbi:MAG: TenA family transcriptional regulator [Rhizonema sp. PD38]|nr:TenA family transcriptional regulator [Rhizonema sp. PD38]
MTITCELLLQNYAQSWQEATVHPFLEECQLGTIQLQQFNTWLRQDYLFVLEFTRMVGRVLASAPPQHFDVILGGLAALKDELNWFQEKASERQLNFNIKKQPTCIEYCEYMQSITDKPYAVQATAFWAIEFSYNQGWQLPGKMPAPYNEFAERWGNPDFTKYVKLLEQQADEVLETAEADIQKQAEESFLRVAKLEHDFWQMAFHTA